MGEQLNVWGVNLEQIRIHYFIIFLSFIYLLFKFRHNKISLLIIFIFYNGLFGFAGQSFYNIYKLLLSFFILYYLIISKSFRTDGSYGFLLLNFIFFTIVFLTTSILNGDNFTIVFSQYSRYFLVYAFFLIFIKFRSDKLNKLYLDKVLYTLILVQIIISIIKYIIMGVTESIVGTIASQGGEIATYLPILGLLFIWYRNKGSLGRNDWIQIAGLLFIGFESGKRAIWFIFPIMLFLLLFYIPKRKINRVHIILLFFAPFIFYLGVRLDPTLNKSHKVWGDFNLSYVMDYSQKYTYGSEDKVIAGTGRVGADYLLYQKLISSNKTINDWIGNGLRNVYSISYADFEKIGGFGINMRGSATGIYQTFISNGFLGIFATLLFVFSILLKTKNKRIKNVLIFFFIWEYLFYTGSLVRDNSMAVLLIYLVVFLDYVKLKPGQYSKI